MEASVLRTTVRFRDEKNRKLWKKTKTCWNTALCVGNTLTKFQSPVTFFSIFINNSNGNFAGWQQFVYIWRRSTWRHTCSSLYIFCQVLLYFFTIYENVDLATPVLAFSISQRRVGGGQCIDYSRRLHVCLKARRPRKQLCLPLYYVVFFASCDYIVLPGCWGRVG